MDVSGSSWLRHTGARTRTSTNNVAPEPFVDAVEVPPMPGLSLRILEGKRNARLGKVTYVNSRKHFGYLKPLLPLSPEYDSSSLFFNFNGIKNTSNNIMRVAKGTTVKFILCYEAKDGNTENLRKPKAFSVYTYDPAEEMEQRDKAETKLRQEKFKEEKDKQEKDAERTIQEIAKRKHHDACEMPRDSKKVSVFWDIENCQPKKGKVLDIVQEVRDMSHNEGFQEQTFIAVCDVTTKPKSLIRDLESANVNVIHRSRKKNSSDEILRQQMRKVVDTSKNPGRIILITGWSFLIICIINKRN